MLLGDDDACDDNAVARQAAPRPKPTVPAAAPNPRKRKETHQDVQAMQLEVLEVEKSKIGLEVETWKLTNEKLRLEIDTLKVKNAPS